MHDPLFVTGVALVVAGVLLVALRIRFSSSARTFWQDFQREVGIASLVAGVLVLAVERQLSTHIEATLERAHDGFIDTAASLALHLDPSTADELMRQIRQEAVRYRNMTQSITLERKEDPERDQVRVGVDTRFDVVLADASAGNDDYYSFQRTVWSVDPRKQVVRSVSAAYFAWDGKTARALDDKERKRLGLNNLVLSSEDFIGHDGKPMLSLRARTLGFQLDDGTHEQTIRHSGFRLTKGCLLRMEISESVVDHADGAWYMRVSHTTSGNNELSITFDPELFAVEGRIAHPAHRSQQASVRDAKEEGRRRATLAMHGTLLPGQGMFFEWRARPKPATDKQSPQVVDAPDEHAPERP